MASPTGDVTDNGDAEVPGFIPLVAVVDFHHHRGPEVERWFGVAEGQDPATEWDWTLLPFMALSDGAHALVFSSPYRRRDGPGADLINA